MFLLHRLQTLHCLVGNTDGGQAHRPWVFCCTRDSHSYECERHEIIVNMKGIGTQMHVRESRRKTRSSRIGVASWLWCWVWVCYVCCMHKGASLLRKTDLLRMSPYVLRSRGGRSARKLMSNRWEIFEETSTFTTDLNLPYLLGFKPRHPHPLCSLPLHDSK